MRPAFFCVVEGDPSDSGRQTSQWILTPALLRVRKGIFEPKMIPNEF